MFNDISCDGKGNEEECVAISKDVSLLAKKFGIDSGHLLVQFLKRSGILWKRIDHKELGSYRGQDAVWIRRERKSYFPCNDSIVQG